jgi:hypothetical protein
MQAMFWEQKMFNFNLGDILTTIAGWSVALLVAFSIPVVRNANETMHGIGWLAYVVFIVIGLTARDFCGRFIERRLGSRVKGLRHYDDIKLFVKDVIAWFMIGLSLCISAAILPSKVSYTSGVAVFVLVFVLGVAQGCLTLIRKHNSWAN